MTTISMDTALVFIQMLKDDVSTFGLSIKRYIRDVIAEYDSETSDVFIKHIQHRIGEINEEYDNSVRRTKASVLWDQIHNKSLKKELGIYPSPISMETALGALKTLIDDAVLDAEEPCCGFTVEQYVREVTKERDNAIAKVSASDAISLGLLDQIHDLKNRLDIDANLQQKHIDNTDKEILVSEWQTKLLQRISDHDLCADVEWEFSKLNRCIRTQNGVNFRQNRELRELKSRPCLNGSEGSIDRLIDIERATYSSGSQDSFDAAVKSMFEKAYRDLAFEVRNLTIAVPYDNDPELVHAAASLDSCGPTSKYEGYVDHDGDDDGEDGPQEKSRDPISILESMSEQDVLYALRAYAAKG